jgi:16S rRNA (cytosine967-C5)-methyltransferase
LAEFAGLQINIATNALKSLRQGGYFLYATCSVFAQENEAIIEKLMAANSNLTLLAKRYITGYTMQADTMFVALLQA